MSVLPVVLEVTGRNISQKKREDKHVKSNDSKSTGRTAGRIKIRAGKQGLTRNALILNILWDWIRKEKEREKNEIQSK